MLGRLVRSRTARKTVPAFNKMRVLGDGTYLSAHGGSVRVSPLVPDVGQEVRGYSWPDEAVVGFA